MRQIHVLDSETIDKIAAGEVVERPASVVKELVENAIDAGATAITVEAKEGGISFLRVTDNGFGMAGEQLRIAFVRHATSKIENAEDLNHIGSLGFRGEALSSIAAVSRVEVISKISDRLTGNKMSIEGGVETEFEEIGAPEGTTFLVRNLFYNTPVRRKFLKQPATEGGYIADLMEHLALSRPDISFQFILGNQVRFHTSGNGDLKEVIYRIFGREIANALVPIQCKREGITVEGYLGKPVLVRANRNYELYYINGRFIKSSVVARAIEDGYKEYLMQHKFPMCVLHITMDSEAVDVNVHPTKMDVRFSNNLLVCETIRDMIHDVLSGKEMIPEASLDTERERRLQEAGNDNRDQKVKPPQPFETKRIKAYLLEEEQADYCAEKEQKSFQKSPVWQRVMQAARTSEESVPLQKTEKHEDVFFVEEDPLKNKEEETDFRQTEAQPLQERTKENPEEMSAEEPVKEQPPDDDPLNEAPVIGDGQLNLFEEKILTQTNRDSYRLIGQVFNTYWMIQFEDKLMIVDQHAAHEKVKYERLMKQYREKQVVSQTLFPPVVVSLSGQEEAVLQEYMETFVKLGFEVEHFGGFEYALRSVPVDLYGSNERELFLSVIDELSEDSTKRNPRVIEEKIASMSCKAAVKGIHRMSTQEAERLIDELLTLDNPYNCPHGRPTIITISQYEMEKKFKRIV